MNLQLWGKREDAACGLCGRRAYLEHILSSCKTALTKGRYRWRHDQVLKELAQCLEEAMKKVKTTGGTTFMQFVRPSREATRAEKQQEHGLLVSAGDWEMLVDLERQLRFPREIRSTELRPDIVIWSRRSKQVIIVELTVPWEDRVEEAYERKNAKYQDLLLEAGWKCWSFPVEVSARGFPAHSCDITKHGTYKIGLISAIWTKNFSKIMRRRFHHIWGQQVHFWSHDWASTVF